MVNKKVKLFIATRGHGKYIYNMIKLMDFAKYFEYIKNLIKPYFPKDDIKEKNPKWLQDDYVKFIRFAEDKIAAY